MTQAPDRAAGAGRSAGGRDELRPVRRRDESRRRLIAAARDTFAERGIRETPVELICERAGFTRGAFYSNFASKEDLFLAVFEVETQVRRRRFSEALAASEAYALPTDAASARRTLAAIARAFVTSHSGEQSWFVLMSEFRLQGMRQPELRERVHAALHATESDLAAEMQQFAARLGVRLAVDVDHVVRAVLALYDAWLEENVLQGRPLAADDAFVTETIPRLLSGLVDWEPAGPL